MKIKITVFTQVKMCLLLLWFLSSMQTSDLLAQSNSFSVTINWEQSIKQIDGNKTIHLPHIKEQDYSFKLPHFRWQEPYAGFGDYNVEINDIQYANAISTDVDYFNHIKAFAPSSVDYKGKTTSSRGKNHIVVDLNPFVMMNGNLQRIVSFKVTLLPKPVVIKPKSFVASSVLGDLNSQWYKIAVTEDGIYKIDRNFLAAAGIDVASVNPSHINIYGNGSGKLPELNSVFREDDLVKNDIVIVGEGDGVFDAEDYILFHAWGPNRIYQNNTAFEREMNIYSTRSYYFIRISSTEPPARVQNQASAMSPNTVVNSYNFFSVYEKELFNLVKGGQRWYGDLFDTELSKSFTFNVPNAIASSPVDFKVIYASNARATGSFIDFIVGNSLLF